MQRFNFTRLLKNGVQILALCVVLGYAIPKAQAGDITTGLIGYWALEENTGTTTADSSGGANTGTLTNGPAWTTSGQTGNAVVFDGSNDYILMSDINAMDGLSAMTVSAWVKTTSTASRTVTSKSLCNGATGTGNVFDLTITGGHAAVKFYPAAGSTVSPTSTALINDNSWHLLTATLDGTFVRLYVDGILDSTLTWVGGALQSGTKVFEIGGYCNGTNLYFPGTIDEVRVYSRALVAADISTLYGASPGKIRFNTNSRVPEYFNGSTWVAANGSVQYVPYSATVTGDLNYGFVPTGVIDGKSVTGSFWFKRDQPGVSAEQNIMNFNNSAATSAANMRFEISIASDNRVEIQGRSSAPATVLDAKSNSTYTDSSWHHVMFAFDLTNAANRYIYVDGVSNLKVLPNTHTNTAIDFAMAVPYESIFAKPDGSLPFYGQIADLWVNIGSFLDLSSATNRALFITAAGTPVYLGSNGSAPTGSQPTFYFTNPGSAWITNTGSGGGFSITGTIATTGTGPGAAGDTTTGLVGWWKYDEGSGLTAVDSGSAGKNGTLTNGAAFTSAGKYNGGLTLDGVNDYVDMGDIDAMDGLTAITLSAWVKTSSAAEIHIIDKSVCTGVALSGSFELLMYNGLDGMAIYPSSGSPSYAEADGTSYINDNTWHMITTTWDGVSIKAYTDGVFQASVAESFTSLVSNASSVQVGGKCNTGTSVYPFPGSLDDIRVYNRALSSTDIAALYANTSCTSPTAQAGKIVYNVDQNVMQYCDGSSWKAMGPAPGTGGGGCSNPSRSAGALIFNSSSSVDQYCDGTRWIQIGK
jgi:hypothetical protein